jgi:TPR repeat protein
MGRTLRRAFLLPSLAVLLGLGMAARAATFDEAVAAIRAKDCARLGEVVNAGIDKNAASLLYVAGLMFDEGLCVDIDTRRARDFLDAGAKQGDHRAAVALGLHYALGDGLPRSYARAGAWLLHAEALELRGLSARELSPRDRVRRDALSEEGKLLRYSHALPPLPADGDPGAEWDGYLRSAHFLATRLIRYPKDALIAGVEGFYAVRVCPLTESVEVSRARLANDSAGPSADRARAERLLQREIERAYGQAQRVLPRPASAAGAAKCIRSHVDFRIE